jgi:hypothetical protein
LSNPIVTLLVASPHGFSSTSNSLGSYLLDKLQRGGYEIRKVNVQAAMCSQKGEANMLSQVAGCDLLVLAFPLYIDCLPAPLIAALEEIADHRRKPSAPKPQRLVAIVNNGFPESAQNATAIAICRQFANETGFQWAGGLSLGGGGIISGAPLEKAGYFGRNIRKSLDLAAADLLGGKEISEQAVKLMAKSIVPKSLYTFFGNRGWKAMAKKYGADKNLYDRP